MVHSRHPPSAGLVPCLRRPCGISADRRARTSLHEYPRPHDTLPSAPLSLSRSPLSISPPSLFSSSSPSFSLLSPSVPVHLSCHFRPVSVCDWCNQNDMNKRNQRNQSTDLSCLRNVRGRRRALASRTSLAVGSSTEGALSFFACGEVFLCLPKMLAQASIASGTGVPRS